MRFEWDAEKNCENIKKHAIDFADATQMFGSPMLVDIDLRADYGEIRYIAIGLLRRFPAVIVFTERNGDIIRMISVRKALKHERERFRKYIQDRLGTLGDDV